MDNVKHLYTELDIACIEIQKRWTDGRLRKEISSFIGDIPKCFKTQPKAVLFRNIVTPDHEFERFISLTEKTSLVPLAIEYTNDKFSTRNQDKIGLIKMPIFEKRNKHQEAVFQYKIIANIQENDNKKFSEIRTKSGEHLVSFHHNLLKQSSPADLECFDLSTWIDINGNQPREYYKKFFAFFLCHAILFESYVTNSDEALFENEVILPAFYFIEKKFGIKPLITPLLPCTDDKYWWCFSKSIQFANESECTKSP